MFQINDIDETCKFISELFENIPDSMIASAFESFAVVFGRALDDHSIENIRDVDKWADLINGIYKRGLKRYNQTKSKVYLKK